MFRRPLLSMPLLSLYILERDHLAGVCNIANISEKFYFSYLLQVIDKLLLLKNIGKGFFMKEKSDIKEFNFFLHPFLLFSIIFIFFYCGHSTLIFKITLGIAVTSTV